MNKAILKSLVPEGHLRAAINVGNFLLVPHINADGTPTGPSPDIAMRIAQELDVECELICFERPGLIADTVDSGRWDICNIADEPARAEMMDFTNSYALIDAHFLIHKDSKLRQSQDVDQVETTIAVPDRAAYDLWLTANLRHATIKRTGSMTEALELFRKGAVTVLAGLKPALIEEVASNPNYIILHPMFTAIRQAVGIKKGNPEVLAFLNKVIANMISTGFIEDSLRRHGVHSKLSIPIS